MRESGTEGSVLASATIQWKGRSVIEGLRWSVFQSFENCGVTFELLSHNDLPTRRDNHYTIPVSARTK